VIKKAPRQTVEESIDGILSNLEGPSIKQTQVSEAKDNVIFITPS
jgi:hypothetical protein